MSDADKLREAIRAARQTPMLFGPSGPFGKPSGSGVFLNIREDLAKALADAAESTLPKTKMVEVWRVEYAQTKINGPAFYPFSASFHVEAEAQDYAKVLSKWDDTACIRVTGPHQQEVPA